MTQIYSFSDFKKDEYYYAIENQTQCIVPLGTCTSATKQSVVLHFCWHDGPTYETTYKIEFDHHIHTELHTQLANFVAVLGDMQFYRAFQPYSFFHK